MDDNATLPEAIELARRSWFAGHAIIVERVNGVLLAKQTGLSIYAEPPSKGLTLLACRLELAEAFRHIPSWISGIPDANSDSWRPWSVGFIDGTGPKDNPSPPVFVGFAYRAITGDPLDLSIGVLKGRPNNWPWLEHIVNPIERYAQMWADKFAEMAAKFDSIQRQNEGRQTRAAEQSDTPLDLTAYVPAKDIVEKYGERISGLNFKLLLTILDENRDIKWHKPSKQRLLVHLADFDSFTQHQHPQADPFEQLDKYEDDVEARTAAIRRQKQQHGETLPRRK